MAPLIRVLLRAAEEHSRKESSFIPPESAEPIQLLRSELMDGTLSLAEDTLSSSAAEDVSSEDDDKEESDIKRCQAPLHFKYRLNRIGSVLSRLKSVPFKRRPRVLSSSSNRSCYYMGHWDSACLFSYIHRQIGLSNRILWLILWVYRTWRLTKSLSLFTKANTASFVLKIILSFLSNQNQASFIH